MYKEPKIPEEAGSLAETMEENLESQCRKSADSRLRDYGRSLPC